MDACTPAFSRTSLISNARRKFSSSQGRGWTFCTYLRLTLLRQLTVLIAVMSRYSSATECLFLQLNTTMAPTLDGLPNEPFEYVVQHLDLPDICHLRSGSRQLASESTQTPFRSFFRTRVNPGSASSNTSLAPKPASNACFLSTSQNRHAEHLCGSPRRPPSRITAPRVRLATAV